MKNKYAVVSSICLLMISFGAIAQSQTIYTADKQISIAGDGGYDYLFIDKPNNRLYVSHGSAVNVIDLANDRVVGTIDGLQGVHGIAVVDEMNKGFISDGRANAVVVFDMNTLKKTATIHLNGKNPDAIIYDPASKKIYAFNAGSDNVSVIDIAQLKETATLPLGGAPEFAVADGDGLIYNNLEDKNSIAVIDSRNVKVIRTIPLAPCGGPTGLALDKRDSRLFTVCRENKGMSVVDIKSGKVIATLPIGSGVDGVVYDEKNKRVLASNGEGTVTVIRQLSADEYQVVQTLKTQARARTMTIDPQTSKIYLSVAQFPVGSRTAVPGTFRVLVYKCERKS